MVAWMGAWGLAPIAFHEYPVWEAMDLEEASMSDSEDALLAYLDRLSSWAEDERLPGDQAWSAAARALAAGRTNK
jgi:hypothetical protein